MQESSGPGHGPGPGDPDSSDTNSNCSDLELEEEISDDSDYGKYSNSEYQRAHSTLATRGQTLQQFALTGSKGKLFQRSGETCFHRLQDDSICFRWILTF